MKLNNKVFLTALSLLLSWQIQAESLSLCVASECNHPEQIKISEQTWLQVKDLYRTSNNTDIEEQENLTLSIKLIENDIYKSIAEASPLLADPQSAYTNNGLKHVYKNIRQIITLLMDHHLVTRHLLRNMLIEKSWYGLKQMNGLLIQSRENARLYVINTNAARLDSAITITPYDRQP